MKKLSITGLTLLLGATVALAEDKKEDADATVYDKLIAPIFEARCVECHGEKKQKGKLRLDSMEAILKGGSEGPAVVGGSLKDSLALVRSTLPEDDDDRMPPKGDPLTKEQIAALKWWIDSQKASFDVKIAGLDLPEPVEELLKGEATAIAQSKPKKTEEKLREVAKADPAKLKPLQDFGILVIPLAQNTNLLQVECASVRDKVTDKELALLEPIADQVEWLYLNNTKITDTGMKHIAKLKGLSRLHMAKTAVTDEGIKQLTGLQNLKTLNIWGTKVTDASLPTFAKLPALQKLYLHETKVQPRTALKFVTTHPKLDLNLGWQFEDFKRIDSGLLFYESFNDQHQGTAVGGKITYSDGASSKAGVFDGKVHITGGDLANFKKSDGFSVAAWVKPAPQDLQVIVARTDSADADRGWSFHIARGKLGLALVSNAADNAVRINSKAALPADQWYYVAASHDGSGKAEGVKLYVDGQPLETDCAQDNLSRPIRNFQELVVGRHSDGAAFKGSIDDIRIYPRVMSPAIMGALFDRFEFKKEPAKLAATPAKKDTGKCPVSGKPASADHVLVVNGKTIGFCCEKCPVSYEKSIRVADAGPKKCCISGKDAVKEERIIHSTVAATYFCCEKCEAKCQKSLAIKVVDEGPKKCEFSGKDAKKEHVVNVNGQVSYYCCEKCVGKAVAALGAKDEGAKKCAVSGEAAKAEHRVFITSSKAVYFCCPKCKAKYNEQTFAANKAKK